MDPVYVVPCGDRCNTFGNDYYGAMLLALLIPIVVVMMCFCSQMQLPLILPTTMAKT